MSDLYSFVDFLIDNSVRYRKQEFYMPDDDDTQLAEREHDKINLSMDEYMEKYSEEYAYLNNLSTAAEFKNYLDRSIRDLRDSVGDLKIHPTNREIIVQRMKDAIDTLKGYQTMIDEHNRSAAADVNGNGAIDDSVAPSDRHPATAVDSPDYIDPDLYIMGEIDSIHDQAIKPHPYAYLKDTFELKIKALVEMMELLSGQKYRPSEEKVPVPIAKSKLSVNQIVILFYHLKKDGVIRSDISQTDLAQLLSVSTGLSSNTIRQGLSSYNSSVKNEEDHFPETDHAIVKRMLDRISGGLMPKPSPR